MKKVLPLLIFITAFGFRIIVYVSTAGSIQASVRSVEPAEII